MAAYENQLKVSHNIYHNIFCLTEINGARDNRK